VSCFAFVCILISAICDSPMASPRPRPRVLVLGHSFVRRLSVFVDNHCEGSVPNFDLPCDVTFIGTGGIKISHLWDQLPRILNSSPDIVILDIGTNDLAMPGEIVPGEIADCVYQFAVHLFTECGVKAVHIAKIFRRLFTTDRTPPDFNDKVVIYNAALRSICLHGQNRLPPLPIFISFFVGCRSFGRLI
jgi:hypothetical protein